MNINFDNIPFSKKSQNVINVIRFVKSIPSCVLKVTTKENQMYKFEYLKDDKIWKIEMFSPSNGGYLIDFKNQIQRYLGKMMDIDEIMVSSNLKVTNSLFLCDG